MKQVATLEFVNKYSEDNALAIVRAEKDTVALALSLQSDGDIEVVFDHKLCERLIDALKSALEIARTAA